MSAPYICPCCGSALPEPPDLATLHEMPLRGIKLRIFSTLERAYPFGVEWEALHHAVYSGAHEPETSYQCIAGSLSDLRKRLRLHGWTVPPIGKIRGATKYRLRPLS